MFLTIGCQSAMAGAGDACDRLAAFPYADANNDIGVPFRAIDVEPALKACQEAVTAFPDTPRFAHQLGRVYDRQGNVEAARQFYEQASAAGYLLGDYSLANTFWDAYKRDETDVASLQQAHHLWLQAAEAGLLHAQNVLGMVLTRKTPIRNIAEGIKWRTRAAEADFPHAQFDLATWLQSGKFVEKDEARAAQLMKKAKDAGLPWAYGRLAIYYEYGIGVEKDKERALALYRQGAALGDRESNEQLASKYRRGIDLPQDFDAMRVHFEKAHAAGSIIAYKSLSQHYLHYKNVERAEHYARAAVEDGMMNAFGMLTVFYCAQFCPDGVIKDDPGEDFEHAIRYYRNQSETEHREKARNVVAFLTKLAEDENEYAQMMLGTFLLDGMRGAIQANQEKARHWFEKAAAQGNKAAIKKLKELDGG